MKEILFTGFLAIAFLSCDSVADGTNSGKTIANNPSELELSLEERKFRVFENLKANKFSKANSLAIKSSVKNSKDEFYSIMKSLTLIGVDSIELARVQLIEIDSLDSNSCASQVKEYLLSLTSVKNMDYEIYLKQLTSSMAYNDFTDLCSSINEPAKPYSVDLETEK